MRSSSQSKTPVDDIEVEDAKAYNEIVSASVDLSDAYVTPDGNTLSVTRTVRDIDANAKRKFLYQIPIPKQGVSVDDNMPFIPPTQLASDVRGRYPSPSGQKIAILKHQDKDKQVMEIWTHRCQCLARRVVLPKAHGKVCHDPQWFGHASWNLQETALVYSAERKDPETKSFFDNEEELSTKDGSAVVGGQYTLGIGKGETWGEKYFEMSALLDLYCLDVNTGHVARIENVPGSYNSTKTSLGGYTLGQAVFSPCGTNVVYSAWDAGGKRLGMIYCYQRPCRLYSSPVSKLMLSLKQHNGETQDIKDPACLCLTPTTQFARSPRFQPGAGKAISKLAFLACREGYDTHDGSVSLCTLDWDVTEGIPNMESLQTLVQMVELPSFRNDDEPEMPQQVANMSFPGLFLNQLPDKCFAPDRDYILTDTQWGSVQRVVCVSLVKALTLLKVQFCHGNENEPLFDSSLASQSFLCFTSTGGALVSESAPNRPTVIGYITPDVMDEAVASGKTVKAEPLSRMAPIAATSFSGVGCHLEDNFGIEYELITTRAPTVPGAADTMLQCILLRPKAPAEAEGKKPPLIVVPHGGPHSCATTNFIPSYAYLCAYGGYTLLFVNYRGSTGFGMAALDSLPGNIGVVDVADVVHATRTVCESGLVDSSRVGICGGSHGGFLAGHCLGQYPNLFQAAAMRNPVTNIASMVTATDIPDWCYVEAFGDGHYNWEKFCSPTQKQLDGMYKASPVAHVSNVVSPTLIALGMSDKRVPPSQGLELYHTLRSRGVTTKLLMYDKDDHAIDGVVSEADHWINIKRWFDEHL